MKKIIALLLVALAFAWPQSINIIQGQKELRKQLVTWNAAANTNKTRILFLANNVYVDTSTTGQANQFKRIDNTADSCSNPFFIASDSLGGSRPVWKYQLWQVTRSVDVDSSTHVFRMQTREPYIARPTGILWKSWTVAGANGSTPDVTLLDTLLVPNVKKAGKWSQYTLGFAMGTQARLCPDDVAATANAAGDSVFADSLTFTVQ